MEHVSLGIAGISGRMGRMLLDAIIDSDRVVLGGASEHPGHAWVGRKLSEMTGQDCGDIIVEDSPREAFSGVRGVLDFTSPPASVALATIASRMKIMHVIGTTGFSKDDLTTIADSASETVIIRAGNMSMGVNLLVRLTEKVAAALDEDFDIEVVEMHHRYKVDAPSGTALMLGEAAAAGRGVDLADMSDRGRDGLTGARQRGTVGFSAIRGGRVVGEHDVIFAADGERIILRHIATDRSIYAQGALKAALWGLEQPPGEYDMCDVLGL